MIRADEHPKSSPVSGVDVACISIRDKFGTGMGPKLQTGLLGRTGISLAPYLTDD
jgi:hypothetical protein